MNQEAIEKSMRSAISSLEMEGFSVGDTCVLLCRQLLMGEITIEEYLARVTPHGVLDHVIQH